MLVFVFVINILIFYVLIKTLAKFEYVNVLHVNVLVFDSMTPFLV